MPDRPLEVGAGNITGPNAGDFKIVPETAFDIADGGADVEVTITCTPGDLGTRTAKLEFSTNDATNFTVSYDLTCEGTAPAASLVVNTLDDENDTNLNKCSLREAIIANNKGEDFGGCADPKGTITFDAALTGTITIINSALPPISQNVEIKGPGSSTLAVSGNNQFRVLDITANLTVDIDKLTITQGSTSGNGGGIQAASGATLTVTNSTLSGNSAGNSGGGILATNVMVTNSTLSGNSSGINSGGGIRADIARVSNSTLSGNSAGAQGGGIFASSATVSNSTLSGNTASTAGGGIEAVTATVSNSTLSGNSARTQGGGISVDNTAIVSNSTLSGNSAGSQGGGIFAFGTVTVTSSTIVLNRANDGGGIRRTGSGSFVVNNTIVAANTQDDGSTPNDIIGTLTGGSNNLIGTGGSGGLTDGTNGNIVGVPNIKNVLNTVLAANSTTIQAGDPNVGTEPVLTHALVMDSPALEAGDPTICAAAPVNNLDQRGVSRPQPVGSINCDIGSFESDLAAPSLMGIVNMLVDENNTGADCSLREAIIANNNSAPFGGCVDPEGTITFAAALNGGTITITTTALPAITQNVVIDGPGANNLTVSGNNQFRVFEIAATNNPVVTFQKLTITQGRAPTSDGGGILSASSGMLTIESVTLSNNTVTEVINPIPNPPTFGLGGGIRATNVTLSNSTLSGNSAGYRGGGIYATTATVSNSTLSGNSAGSGGGGISATTVTVSNSTISGNSAGGGGGIDTGTATVSNSTLSGNSADGGGGIRAATATVSNSTLSGNTARYNGGGILSSTTVILNSNKFGIAVPGGTPNVAPSGGPNVRNLNGNTGSGNDPDTCNATSGNC